ncbi:hypothetical protein PR048_032101 [Dryococelus australis]|uniref:Uncharacterized protein n=1 Tax=Dryococelus australis TaxID=614101 RepID=A0ABQ9G194_9NEOP|nr:hypothetical protein PR048_032101 [Dryococelus australis]
MVVTDLKSALRRRKEIRLVATVEIKENVLKKCDKRNDELGEIDRLLIDPSPSSPTLNDSFVTAIRRKKHWLGVAHHSLVFSIFSGLPRPRVWPGEPDSRSPGDSQYRLGTGSHPPFRMGESCQTMPLVGGFSRGSPVPPSLSFRRRSILTSIALICSEDLAITSSQTLFKHSAGTPR